MMKTRIMMMKTRQMWKDKDEEGQYLLGKKLLIIYNTLPKVFTKKFICTVKNPGYILPDCQLYSCENLKIILIKKCSLVDRVMFGDVAGAFKAFPT